MGFFNYHIGTHLLRPATITTNITYTPNGTTNPIALSDLAETSIITSPFDGNAVNTNFYNLAISATDLTHRVEDLESYSTVAESTEVGYITYVGRREAEGYLYGGTALLLSGVTSFTMPYTLDAGNKIAFQVAALNGIVYDTAGSVDQTDSKFRPLSFGQGGAGSPYATPSALLTYLRTKMRYSVPDAANTYIITGTGNPAGGSWGTTFGTISSTNPKSFYVFWNDGYTPYSLGSTYSDGSGFIHLSSDNTIVGAKCTLNYSLTQNINLLQGYIQNLLNIAIGNGNTFVVSVIGGTNLQLSVSADRTQYGVAQVTLLKDVVGDGGNTGIIEWLGWYANAGTGTAPANAVELYDYGSFLDFSYTGTGPYYLNLIGAGAYAPMSFIDGYTANGYFLSTYGLPANTTTYYNTRPPQTSYAKVLNYGGDFWASSLNSSGDVTINGNLTVQGGINTTASSGSYVLPSYIPSFEINNTNDIAPVNWIPYANTSPSSTPTSGGLKTIYTYAVLGTAAITGTVYVNGVEVSVTSGSTAAQITTQFSQLSQQGYNFSLVTTSSFAIAVSGVYPSPTVVLGTLTGVTFTPSTNYGTPSNLVTLLVNGSSPLFGNRDVILSKDAINRQGQGFSTPFSIEAGVTSQPVQLTFYYKTSTNYQSGDISLFVYDVINANLIPLSISAVPASVNPGLFTATFYPSATSLSYNLIYHIASTNANAWTFEFDNVSVAPQNSGLALCPSIGPWTQYTMTIGAVTTPPTKPTAVVTDIAVWRRVGSDMEIMYHYSASTLTGSVAGTGTYLYPLPSGYTIDTSKIGTATLGYTVGIGHVSTVTLQEVAEVEVNPNTSVSALTMEMPNVAGNNLQDATRLQSSTVYPLTTATEIQIIAKVPISQWSSQINLTTDFTEYASNTSTADSADTTSFYNGKDGSSFPVALSANRAKRIQFTRPIQVTDKIEIEVYDTSVGQWFPHTACRVGSLSWTTQYSGSAISYGIFILGLAALPTQLDVTFSQYARPTGTTFGAAGEAWTNYNTGSNNISRWRVRKISNGNTAEQPSLIRAEYTETSAAAIEASAARLNFNVKVEDTNSAVTTGASTWAFTAPAPGVYQVTLFGETASNTPAAGDNLIFDIYASILGAAAAQYRRLGKAFAYAAVAGATDFNYTSEVRLNTGDYFYIQLTKTGYAINWATSTGASPLLPRIIITRIGS